MFSFTKLQNEQKPWVAHNFPGRAKHQPLLGMFEEYGELLVAETGAEIQDAVADITIFLTDFCNANDFSIDQILYMNKREDIAWMDSSQSLNGIAFSISKISHHYLKREQNIRGDFRTHTDQIEIRISQLIGFLRHFSRTCGFDYERAVSDTWVQVSKRDWRRAKEDEKLSKLITEVSTH